MRVVLTPRARARAKAVAGWWRANRTTAPDLFERELEAAKNRLALEPRAGRFYARIGDSLIRRVLLPRTEQHVYYEVDEKAEMVLVHTIWGARRGRGPDLQPR